MTTLQELDPDAREWQGGEGDFYCPGCGSRFDTAGVCTGPDGSGHEPTAVEKVAGSDGEKVPRTHAELDEYAAEHGIDLGDAATVEEKRHAIEQAEQQK